MSLAVKILLLLVLLLMAGRLVRNIVRAVREDTTYFSMTEAIRPEEKEREGSENGAPLWGEDIEDATFEDISE